MCTSLEEDDTIYGISLCGEVERRCVESQQLKPLGYIFNFATLSVKRCRRHLMRSFRLYGSVRGAAGNRRPYRDRLSAKSPTGLMDLAPE